MLFDCKKFFCLLNNRSSIDYASSSAWKVWWVISCYVQFAIVSYKLDSAVVEKEKCYWKVFFLRDSHIHLIKGIPYCSQLLCYPLESMSHWSLTSHCCSGLLVWHAGRYSLLARFPMVEWTHSQWSNYWRVEEDSTNPQIQLAQRKCESYLQQVVTQVGVNALQNQFRLISFHLLSFCLLRTNLCHFVYSTYNYIITKCKVLWIIIN